MMFIFIYLVKNMLYFELKKIFTNRRILICMVVLLIGVHLFSGYQSLQQEWTANEYKQLHERLDQLPTQDRMAFLKESFDKSEYHLRVNDTQADVSYYTDTYGLAWMEAIQKQKNEVFFSRQVLKQVEKEEQNRIGYDRFRKGIKKQYALNHKVSIFQKKEDPFVEQRAVKTMDAYETLNITMPASIKGSYGIEQLLSQSYLDIALLLFLVFLFYEYVVREEEYQQLSYMQLTKHGRLAYYMIKIIALWFTCSLFIFLTSFTLWIQESLLYGFADLSACIQSIPFCMRITKAYSILQFLLLTLAFKSFVCLLFIIMFYGMYFMVRNDLLAIAIMLGIGGSGWGLSAIFADSAQWFASLHPMQLLHVQDAWIQVQYLRVFDQAIYYNWIYAGIACFSVLFGYLGYRGYRKKGIHEKHVWKFYKQKHNIYPLWVYESKKLWLKDGGLLIVGISLFLMMMLFPTSDTFSTLEDAQYNYYIDKLGNEVTPTLLKKMDKEEKRLASLRKQFQLETDVQKKEEIFNALRIEEGFRYYKEKVEQLQMEPVKHKLIKENEIRFLFDNHEFFKTLLFLYMTMLILLAMKSYEREEQYQFKKMQQLCGYHYKTIHRKKMFSVLAGCLFVYGMVVLRIAYQQHWLFPHMDMRTLFCDIPQYYASHLSLPLGILLLLQILWQLVVLLCLLYLLLYLFKKTQHNKVLAACLLCVLALPCLFANPCFKALLGFMFYSFHGCIHGMH